MNITLSPDEIATLQHLAALQNITLKQALTKTLADELYIKEQLARGSTFLLMNKKGIKQIVFNQSS